MSDGSARPGGDVPGRGGRGGTGARGKLGGQAAGARSAPAARAAPASAELGIQLAEYTMPAEFRRPLVGRLIWLLPAAALSLILGYSVRGAALIATGWVITPFAVVNLSAYLWRGRFSTRLTSEGIVARGYFTHFVPWREVGYLEVHGLHVPMPLGENFRPGHLRHLASQEYGRSDMVPARVTCRASAWGQRSRLATVTVVRADGSKLLLRAPLVTDWAADHLFAEKAAEISTLARWHTGAPL
jgi:hypothetical protein